MKDGDLTPRQLAVLVTVANNEGLSQTGLVDRTGIDRSTLADIVRRLQRKGLLQRRRTKEDARAYAVKLTDEGRRVLRLDSAGLRLTFAISSTGERRSLDPARYFGPAKLWGSCTPIVLDRHLKAAGNEARENEIIALVSRGCLNIGLPEPRRISAGKHSAVEGSPSAYPSGQAPRWLGWRLPESLASRQLTHAVLEFAEPVHGPVILGAGRFVGLGLCLPLDRESRQ